MARKQKDGEFLNVKLSRDVYEALEKYAESSKLSKTAVVEIALEQFLACSKSDDE